MNTTYYSITTEFNEYLIKVIQDEEIDKTMCSLHGTNKTIRKWCCGSDFDAIASIIYDVLLAIGIELSLSELGVLAFEDCCGNEDIQIVEVEKEIFDFMTE